MSEGPVDADFQFRAGMDAVLSRQKWTSWSVCIRGASGAVLYEKNATLRLSTASVGKLFLLLEVARRFDDGTLLPTVLLSRRVDLSVGDSGLWQYLRGDCLPAEDLAVLVASVSDNLATNVLLERVGLSQVQQLARDLGFAATTLHDRVRDSRSDEDEPLLSSGNSSELSMLMHGLYGGDYVSPEVSKRVLNWMLTNTDLSMVASALGLDPLAHTADDGGISLHNKTGTDSDVMADVGVLIGPTRSLTYAVVANWPSPGPDRRRQVLAAMRELGELLRVYVAGDFDE
jgi:beta-lactamase class A